MKRTEIAFLLIVSSLAVSGCVVAAVGAAAAGTVVYVRGEIESYFDSDVQSLYNAADKAMDDLKLYVVSRRHDALYAEIIARNATDQKITVRIDGSRRELVKVMIRVGFWGDESASRAILDRINANLYRR
jgi:hypothetical protein